MDDLVTILTVTYQHELIFIQGRIESEGIETFLQDEFLIQVDPLYSNAVGGIKLQVRRNDSEKALELLKEWGYIKPEERLASSNLAEILNKYTCDLPMIGKYPLPKRIFYLVGFLLIFLMLIYAVSF